MFAKLKNIFKRHRKAELYRFGTANEWLASVGITTEPTK